MTESFAPPVDGWTVDDLYQLPDIGVLKRHYYAAGGIPHYWIADPKKRTLTVMALDGDSYIERILSSRAGRGRPTTRSP